MWWRQFLGRSKIYMSQPSQITSDKFPCRVYYLSEARNMRCFWSLARSVRKSKYQPVITPIGTLLLCNPTSQIRWRASWLSPRAIWLSIKILICRHRVRSNGPVIVKQSHHSGDPRLAPRLIRASPYSSWRPDTIGRHQLGQHCPSLPHMCFHEDLAAEVMLHIVKAYKAPGELTPSTAQWLMIISPMARKPNY